MISRKTELRRQIRELRERINNMINEALSVERGKLEAKKKFDANGDLAGSEETLKFQPSAAVGYWREVREHEKRLDDLAAELRAIGRFEAGEPINVTIHYDGPDRDA